MIWKNNKYGSNMIAFTTVVMTCYAPNSGELAARVRPALWRCVVFGTRVRGEDEGEAAHRR